jgi:DnaJ family protein B protein 4
MTISKKPSERGDLVVRVNVEFPKTLSASAKEVLKDVLP